MTQSEINSILEETGKAIEAAVGHLDRLATVISPVHQSMIEPTMKIKERLEKEADELLALRQKPSSDA